MTDYKVTLSVDGTVIEHSFRASRFYIDPGNNNLLFFDKEPASNPLAVIKAGHWISVERPYAV